MNDNAYEYSASLPLIGQPLTDLSVNAARLVTVLMQMQTYLYMPRVLWKINPFIF